MTSAASNADRFLVEWYLPDLTRQVVDAVVHDLDEATAGTVDGSPVWLLVTLAVPSDEVLYGIFAAQSEESVLSACARAGLEPQRVSVGVDARITAHV